MDNFTSLIFYIFIFLFSAFLLNNKSKYKKLTVFLGFAILVTVASLRYMVGTDFQTYMNIISRYGNMPWNELLSFSYSGDFGFKIFTKSIYQIGGHKLFFAVSALFTILPIYLIIKNNFQRIYTGLSFVYFLLLFYPASYNIIRQYIAAGIIFYSLKYIFSGNSKKFILLILLAFLFHKSAIVFLPVYFFWNHRENKIANLRIIIPSMVIVVIMVLNYSLVIEFFSSLQVFESYSTYSISQERGSNRDFFVYLLMLIIFFIFLKKLRKIDERNMLFFIMFFIGVVISLTGFYHPQVKRIAIYYQLPSMILIGYLPMVFVKEYRFFIMLSITVTAMMFFIVTYYVIGNAQIFPYRFW